MKEGLPWSPEGRPGTGQQEGLGMEIAVGGETQSRKSEEEEEMSTGPKSPHVF